VSEQGGAGASIGLLVVTHGKLAEELVASLRRIVGELESPVEAVSIDWNDNVDEARRRIEQSLERLRRGSGALIVTDMFGGTPANLALALHEAGRVEIVTGVNLPMLIKFAGLPPSTPLARAATTIAAQGRESIQVASEVLRSGTAAGEPEPR
jgi:PTS system mannose-specific IIA component